MLRGGEKATKMHRLTSLLRVMSAFMFSAFFINQISPSNAANLVTRSIRISSSLPSEITTHEFRFRTFTAGALGSIVFEYCSNLPFYGAPCTPPAGLDVDNAVLSLQSGITGFTVSDPDTTANKIVLSRPAAAAAPIATTYRFSSVTNQSTSNQSVYVRISVHSSVDGTGAPIDNGSVVYSTVEGVGVGGYVPPHLTFCVGVTVAINCSTMDGSLLDLGELSPTSTKTTTSQFAAATNDPSGYNTFVSGGTMTSGNEIIPALSDNADSQQGTSQFGINLRSNSEPGVGANVSGGGTGVAVSGYNTPNSFRYNDGELIARSTLPTDYNRYTVSYIINVSKEQKPGIYASSFTYTAIASF